jgi:hypothetical protein
MGANENTKLADTDRDLNEHFTAANGAKGQKYERAPSGGDTCIEEIVCSPWRQRELSKYAAIDTVLGGINADARRTIRAVYASGAGVLAAESERAIGLIEGRDHRQDPFGLLRLALVPRWGHGSFLRLAVQQDRALRAFAKRYPGRSPDSDRVLDFLAAEAGRGDSSASMLAALRDECEEQRMAALRVFQSAFAMAFVVAKRAREVEKAEQQRVEDRARFAQVAKVRTNRISGRIPACLRLTDDQRERMRAAALAMLGDLAEAES